MITETLDGLLKDVEEEALEKEEDGEEVTDIDESVLDALCAPRELLEEACLAVVGMGWRFIPCMRFVPCMRVMRDLLGRCVRAAVRCVTPCVPRAHRSGKRRLSGSPGCVVRVPHH